jgi:hypothetical protein
MKIHWQFLKKPSVIVGAIILFFILLFLLNRGGSSASGGQVVNTGPSDAQVGAQTQLAMATMSAGLQGQAIQADYAKSQDSNQTQLALATIAAAVQGQSLAVQSAIAQQTVAAQVHGLDLQYQTALANNNFALNYAAQQFNFGLANTAINANLQSHMADLQASSFNLAQELSHVTDVRLHGGQRLAVLQNIINTNGSVASPSSTSVIINPTNMGNLTGAGQLA